MALRLLSLLLVLAAAATLSRCSASDPQCEVRSYEGCFKDSPHGRIVDLVGATLGAQASPQLCANLCGFAGLGGFSGLTGGTGNPTCYCSLRTNTGFTPQPESECAGPCPGNSSAACGNNGYMALYRLSCSGPSLPSPEGKPLKPGRACSQPEVRSLPFCDTSLGLDARVTDLVNRISMVEAGQMLTARESPTIPRLGLPSFYWGTNAIHGVRVPCVGEVCATSFPETIALSAGFNKTMIREVGFVIGKELRALTNSGLGQFQAYVSWSPTINIIRDPRWGRNQETVSEDPVVSGVYGAQFTLGLQNGSVAAGFERDPNFFLAISTLKHFVAYSLEDYMNHTWTRQTFNAIVSPFDLEDTYFRAFQIAIQTANAQGIMYSCNEVNGKPTEGDPGMDQKLLSWGFDGYRSTDGGQIEQMVHNHKYVPTIEQAIHAGLSAESDIDDGGSYAEHLLYALANGNATVALVRRALFNTLRMRFRLGLFDDPTHQPYSAFGASDINDGYARATNALASREALVLLKNDNGTLPFPEAASVAVIGPHGNDSATLQGSYGGAYCPKDQPDCFPGVAEAVGKVAKGGAVWAPGCQVEASSDQLLQQAVQAAEKASHVLLVLGLTQSQESEQHDRVNITLPQAQVDLALRILAVGKPTALVLVHGGGLSIDTLSTKVTAILDAHYPGVAGGSAVADAVFGRYNPGGKLPYTVYRASYQAESNFTDMSLISGQGRTYRYYRGEPLYPAFFGLSYTTFELSWKDERLREKAKAESSAPPPKTLSVTVTNTGDRDGDEVLFAFTSPKHLQSLPNAAVPTHLPFKQLFDYQRLHVPHGGHVQHTFDLPEEAFALTTDDGRRLVFPGTYTVSVSRGHGEDLTLTVQWP